MSLESYPLIGVDRNNNEHHIEWQGTTAANAAKRVGILYKYTKVLSGSAGMKRGPNGNGIYHRKELWAAAPKFNFTEETLEQKVKAFNEQMVKNPQPLIRWLHERGLDISANEYKGKLRVCARPLVTCTLTKEERGMVGDLIRENVSTFIEALEGDSAPPPGAGDKTTGEPKDQPPPDELKGKTLQEVILSMLPQMPTPFTVDDLLERLKASGYIALSEQRTRVHSNIYRYVNRIPGQRGKYQVAEAYRRRRATVEETRKEETTPPQPPEPEILASPPTELDAQSLVPPREVVEVPPPPREPEMPEEIVIAPLAQERVIAAAPFPTAVTTLLELATQAATEIPDSASLSLKLNEACQQFENSMLEAVGTLTQSVKHVAEQLNKQARMRNTLLQSLTAKPNSEVTQ